MNRLPSLGVKPTRVTSRVVVRAAEFTAWLLIALNATPVSADPQKQPYGIYELGNARRWDGTIDGVRLPSCGDEALKTVTSHATLVVEYSKARSDLVIDGEGWKSIWLGDRVFARKRDTPGYLLTLRFSREKHEARGLIVYMQVDADEKPVCTDALHLTGTFERR
jgi:hypothetical protein